MAMLLHVALTAAPGRAGPCTHCERDAVRTAFFDFVEATFFVAPLRRSTSAFETSPAETSAETQPDDSFAPLRLKQRLNSALPTSMPAQYEK
jgi:hypothetical protein